MRLLLDTHILIWAVFEPRRLTEDARRLISDEANEKLFSVASIWETAIKSALGRPGFTVDPARLVDAARLDFTEVVVTSAAAIRAGALPYHHRDPFDRLLVAQAIEAGARLFSVDRRLSAYGPTVLLTTRASAE